MPRRSRVSTRAQIVDVGREIAIAGRQRADELRHERLLAREVTQRMLHVAEALVGRVESFVHVVQPPVRHVQSLVRLRDLGPQIDARRDDLVANLAKHLEREVCRFFGHGAGDGAADRGLTHILARQRALIIAGRCESRGRLRRR